MTTHRTDDTPNRIIDVLRRGPATFSAIILAPEFAGPVGGSIPASFVLAAVLELIDAGTVKPCPIDGASPAAWRLA